MQLHPLVIAVVSLFASFLPAYGQENVPRTSEEVLALIDGLPEAGGKITLGPYDYYLSSPYMLGDNTTLEGVYGATRLLLPTNARFNAIQNSGSWGGNTHISISNLSIVGNYQYEGNYGIDLKNVTRASVENVTIVGTDAGLTLEGDNSGTPVALDAVLHNVVATNCAKKGILLQGIENVTLTQCSAHRCGGQGFWSTNSHGVSLVACIANENGEQGFMPSGGSTRWTMVGCIGSENIKTAITLNDDSSQMAVSACIGDRNGSGIRVRSSQTLVATSLFNNNDEYGVYLGGANPISSILLSSCTLLGNGLAPLFIEEDVTGVMRGGLLTK